MSNVEKVKTVPAAKREKAQKKGDKYYYASQWSLMMRKFRKHKCDRTGYLRNRETVGQVGETVENQRRGVGNGWKQGGKVRI